MRGKVAKTVPVVSKKEAEGGHEADESGLLFKDASDTVDRIASLFAAVKAGDLVQVSSLLIANPQVHIYVCMSYCLY